MFGRMQAGTEDSRYSVGSGRKRYVIRTDDAGLDEDVVRTDGTVDRWASGRLTGNLKSSIFFAVQNLLKML
jgi:hypothetical protein